MSSKIKLVQDKLSDTLYNLFLQWQEEFVTNCEHDINETKAWNELVNYLMELEKGNIKPVQ